MRLIRAFLVLFILIGISAALGIGAPLTIAQNVSPSLPLCLEDAEQPICRVESTWTAETLRQRMEQEGTLVWADGDQLTFAYEVNEDEAERADSVQVCCGIQERLLQIPDSNLWVLTVKIDRLSEALISYNFGVFDGDFLLSGFQSLNAYRGPDAPIAPTRADPLTGEIREVLFESRVLSARRDLTIYLPPGYDPTQRYPVIYATDGQGIADFAAVLEPLIVDGIVPPLLLVGVYSAQSPIGGDFRAQEYLPGMNPQRFIIHERFFTHELRLWAEETLGASTNHAQRAVFGYSNGGVFAAQMAATHIDIYGYGLAFSLGMMPSVTLPKNLGNPPGFYMVAGTLEERFFHTTQTQAGRFEDAGAEVIFQERVSGHDVAMWLGEFPAAVKWAFGSDESPTETEETESE